MMDGEAVQKIAELAAEATRDSEIVVGGFRFTERQLTQITPQTPFPEPYLTCTLVGLVDYLTANRDGLDLETLIVHARHDHVMVSGPFVQGSGQRPVYIKAVPPIARVDSSWMGQTEMVVLLNLAFQPDDEEHTTDRDELIRLVSAVSQEAAVDESDDGLSQKVSTRQSLVFKNESELPNPCWLRPWWTFREVDQPRVPFLLRAQRTGATVSFRLIETQGHEWAVDVVDQITEYLQGTLPGELVEAVIR